MPEGHSTRKIAGVFMVVAAFAVYELLVWVVDKLLAALDRRRVS